ncbi:MAG: fumarylacetoacetate hydrolase family protein [Flavobacteriales bacterium]|nr:fumarylacetoacetate hydrolase family protein [Flavobacteriales bacterium]
MKIICIGRNYAEHAKELGNALPTEPVFFCKPDSAILPKGNPMMIPDWTKDLHYECELVVRINRLGKNIPLEFASRYYDEIGLGIDFTARDVQDELKKKGLPWEKAKAFDGSAVIGQDFLGVSTFQNPKAISFSLKKNGEVVQSSDSSHMIFSMDQIISFVSQYMTLKIGDYIFTGTPSGVGPVISGDILEGFIEEKNIYRIKVR